jgi:hypothetical protein
MERAPPLVRESQWKIVGYREKLPVLQHGRRRENTQEMAEPCPLGRDLTIIRQAVCWTRPHYP